MAVLRIFSYLPNPRLAKATIAARIAKLEVEVRGAPMGERVHWLWDVDARPLTHTDRADASLMRKPRVGATQPLYKTDAFLKAHPFGTVPAAFAPDKITGIFESNSIMRLIGRLADPALGVYGANAYEASRIDGFLDVALTFARDSQSYLLALLSGRLDAAIHTAAATAFDTYVSGIERALREGRAFLVGDMLTLADICFVAELSLFAKEVSFSSILEKEGLPQIWNVEMALQYSSAMNHFTNLAAIRPFGLILLHNLQRWPNRRHRLS